MKKIVKRTLSGIICFILAALLYLGSVASQVQAGMIASNASEDTKKIYTEKNVDYDRGTAQNPFTILEIVPNHSMAKIGYLIPGCEPINMEELKKDDKAFQIYCSVFAESNEGEETPVTVADTDLKKFADQLPENVTAMEPTLSQEEINVIKSMAPSDISWVAGENGSAMWEFVAETYTETGYYQYIEDGTGYFDLENRDTAPVFVYNKEHKGSYHWVEEENTMGIGTDYTSDQVWTTRTSNYYFEYKERSIFNNDLLVKNVFGTSTQNGFVSQVVTLTPEELNSEKNLALIDTADMIVIGQDSEKEIQDLWNLLREDEDLEAVDDTASVLFRQNDVPWAAIKRLAERMASENPAALLWDKTTYDNDGTKSTNLTKLAIMLLQYEPVLFLEYYFDKIDQNGTYTDENKVSHEEWVCSEDARKNTFPLSLAKNKNITSQESEIIGDNIYSYSDFSTFTHGYSAAKYKETAQNKEAFDFFEERYGSRPEILSAGEFVKYILSSYYYKTAIKILEVEPCNSFIYPGDDYLDTYGEWKEYYRALIPWMKGDLEELIKEGKLEINTMPSWEFIGMIQDLNAEYDMIVFGPKQNETNGVDGYNDANMNGLIYSSIGDKVLKDADATRQFKEMQSGEVLRYSGNDLTQKKFVEVKNFLQGGKPIVVDSLFYTKADTGISTSEVNKETVDESSYAYQLFALAGTEEGKNIFVTDRLDMQRMKSLLSKETCEIEFYTADGGTGCPVEYTYETKDENGYTGVIMGDTVTYVNSQIFAYQFRINGKQKETYGVKLYIDRNGDGIYKGSLKENVLNQNNDESEEIENLTVTDMYGNIVDAENLQAGVWYRMWKELPENYVGILPWKLEVYDIANSMIRDNEIKYSAIKTNVQNREKIRVLQMNLVVNLGEDTSQPEGVIMATEGYENDTNAQKFRKYLGAVNDFDVTVDFLTNKSWADMFYITQNTNESWEDFLQRKEKKIKEWEAYLDNYDMLMIGYKDIAEFTNDDVFQAGFEYFVEQGKSLILSHDLMADASFAYDHETDNLVTNYSDKLRELLSQRRYYSSTVKLKGTDVPLISELTLQDGQKHNGNLGFMDITSLVTMTEDGVLIPDYGDNSNSLYLKYGPILNDYKYSSETNNSGAHADRDCFETRFYWPGTTEYVNINNEGQITNYPYKLDPVIKIAKTHTQWAQLNLDDEDMVVWYSLTDEYSKKYSDEINDGAYKNDDRLGRGIYSSRESDIRNNFYIYNVGNITYTGMGHTGTLTDDEVKLFVNTMISAYRAIPDNPYAEVTNTDKVEKSKKEVYLYVSMDEANFDYTNENLEVAFQVTDPSWLQTAKKSTYMQFATDELGTELLSQQPPLYVEGTSDLAQTVEISSLEDYVYLQKPANWGDKVFCYVYSGVNGLNENAAWPGIEMEKVNEEGLYRYKILSSIISPRIIFTDGSNQYPEKGQNGLSYESSSMIADGTNGWSWTTYPEKTQQAYQVTIDGKYYFKVSYMDLVNKGQLEYYLCLKSSYTKNGNTVMNQEVTKVTILPMPLFDLN